MHTKRHEQKISTIAMFTEMKTWQQVKYQREMAK